MALSISTNSSLSGQINTQSPQTSAGSGSPPTTAAKNVQPGTASNLLSGQGGGSAGIPLKSTVLPVASLNSSARTASQNQPLQPTSPQHHPNTILVGIVVVLFGLAILAFWLARGSAKNTTNY